MRRIGARTDLLPYALLLPCIVFLALLILIPMVQALLLAVQADSGGFTTEYLERMRVDVNFNDAWRNTLLLIVLIVPLQIVLALAMALSTRKGFKPENFADLHPGGRLGRRLMRVEALMQTGDGVPRVAESTAMPEVIHEMTSKRLGMTCVADDKQRLLGIVTDGDLRRHMATRPDLLSLRAADVMTRHPIAIPRTATRPRG